MAPIQTAKERLRRLARSLRPRRRGERAQVSAEYVGMILVVAAVIGAIAVTDIGQAVTGRLLGAIGSLAAAGGGAGNGSGGGSGGGGGQDGEAGGDVPPGQTYGPGGGSGSGGSGGGGPSQGEHSQNPTGTQSDPVNSLTGAYVTQVTDAQMPGVGMGFSFARSYTSADDTEGELGRGWSHAYGERLILEPTGDAVLHSGTGQRSRFRATGDGFAPTAGVYSDLERSSNGFLLTTRERLRYRFDSSGKLLELSDRNENRMTFAYDAAEGLESITDSAGRVVRLDHDAQGRLAGLRLPDGRSVRFSYEEGLLTGVRDLRGGLTRYAYDEDGRLTRLTDALGRTTLENEYADEGRVTSQTDALGNESSFEWDEDTQTSTITDARGEEWSDVYARGRLVARTDPLGATTRYRYDAAHNPVEVTDPLGRRSRMDYDERGRMVTSTDALGGRETISYTPGGEPETVTDPRGDTTRMAYDDRGNLLRVTDAEGAVTRLEPDARGLVAAATDPRGKTTRTKYDRAGNLETVELPSGRAESFSYDQVGRLVGASHPEGSGGGHEEGKGGRFPWAIEYDAADQPVRMSDPLGHAIRLTYDATGRRTATTDAKGRTATYRYDPAGRLAQSTAPGGATTRQEYDERGDLVRRIDPRGGVQSVEYDAARRPVGGVGPSGERVSYEYDPAGSLTRLVDANGNATDEPGDGETRFAYDGLGRPTRVDYADPATPDVGMAYDAAGDLVKMSDGQGTETYERDRVGRLTRVSRGESVFAYRYDDAGQLTERAYPDGARYRYGYDTDGQLASTAGPEGRTSYRHDAEGNLTETRLPNGVRERRSYDEAERLTDIVAERGGRRISFTALELDATSNPTRVETEAGTRHNGYDARDQLVSSCATEDCSDPGAERFAYDPAGNRTRAERGGQAVSYSYDASSRLTEMRGPGGVTPVAHDPNGNLTRSGARSYAYDGAGRLARVSERGLSTSYAYDGAGKRTAAATTRVAAPPERRAFAWDTSSALPQIALERSGGQERRYSYGEGRIAQSDRGGGDAFFHQDHLGSTKALTSERGSAKARSEYGPWGARRGGEQATEIGFTGERQDPDTGLVHLRARDMDPATGRFLGPDPVAPGVGRQANSPYLYADNRPTALTDPTGLFTHDAIGNAISSGAEAAWNHRGTIASVGAVGVCVATAGVGCAAAGVAAAAINIEQSAEENVIGKANPNWGEFAIDTALSYPGAKAGNWVRDLSRPLRFGDRTSDIARATLGLGTPRSPTVLRSITSPAFGGGTRPPLLRPGGGLDNATLGLAADDEAIVKALGGRALHRWQAWRGASGLAGVGARSVADDRLGAHGAK